MHINHVFSRILHLRNTTQQQKFPVLKLLCVEIIFYVCIPGTPYSNLCDHGISTPAGHTTWNRPTIIAFWKVIQWNIILKDLVAYCSFDYQHILTGNGQHLTCSRDTTA